MYAYKRLTKPYCASGTSCILPSRVVGSYSPRWGVYLQAGLCSREICGKLQEASGSPPEVVIEKHLDKLSLALEPVCAAIYCQTISEQHVAESYQLVVDIGGGTVDISAHRVSSTPDQHLEVIHLLTRENCGGSTVNKEFQKFLEELVNDKGFSRYLETGDRVTDAKHSAELNELVNKTFEDQKVMFGKRSEVASKPGSKVPLRLPLTGTFFDFYKGDIDTGIKRMKDLRLKMNRQDLRIAYSKMADFFQPVVKEILDCILKCMVEMLNLLKLNTDEVESKFDTIYLIGGFGGSQFIYDKITEHFEDSKCIIPEEHDFAVVRGAIYFRQYPDFKYSSYPTCTPHHTNN